MANVNSAVDNISRFKKENHLKEMSEDNFRDIVIRPLFFRLGYGDGRDVCGPLEKGKDTIFTEKSKIGQIDLIAVQTKKGNLNLSSKATQNVVSAEAQLQTALKTSIPMLSQRAKCYPSKVILCASGKINDNAKTHILEEVKDPRLSFLDSDEIIPLIDKYLPEFWLGIDADITPYYKAVRELVEGTASRDDGEITFKSDVLIGAATDKSYIQLSLYRTTVKRKKVSGRFTEKPDFEEITVADVITRSSKKLLLLGEAGSGKSTALLRVAYEIANQGVQSGANYRIPILLRASEIDRENPESFVEYCDITTRRLSNTNKSCFSINDLNEGRVVLLVDALDEVSGAQNRDHVVTLVNDFSLAYPKCRIIMTSRPYAYIKGMVSLSAYQAFNISPISFRQAGKIIKKLQEGKKISQQNSRELLRRLEEVHGIELNPLLVTVFAATAEYNRQDIPANITELFKKFTELLLGRWDENKGLAQQYQAPVKDFLLSKIAFFMHREGLIKIGKATFDKIVNEQLERLGHSAHLDQMLNEILYRSGLFRIIGNEIEFRHHLLQEFFAGRGIPSVEFVKEVVVNEWWKRAIVFYFGDRPSKVENLIEVLKSTVHKDGALLSVAVTTIGLAIQACYLSEVEQKLEIWKSVTTAISMVRNTDLVYADSKSTYPLTSFVYYYLYSRDALALSNIKDNIEELEHWIEDSTLGDSGEQEAKLFWFIAALIEIGELKIAKKLVDRFKPNDSRYLLAIHMGAYLAKELREIESEGKEAADEICRRIAGEIEPLRVQLMKEFGSQLLEVRRGEIEAIPQKE